MTLVTLDDIRAAERRVRPLARVTPIVDVPWPGATARSGEALAPPAANADRSGGASAPPRLLLKCESLQPMGAFKIRGAANMLSRLSPEELQRGVITYSSGNHGQAVAMAAHGHGVPAVIVMPTTAPRVKADGCRAFGAEVIFEGTTTLDRQARAEQEATERGLTMVPPFDHPWIIEGQGTTALEVLDQVPRLGTILVEVGGGGLISGVSAAIKQAKPTVRVIGVEPAGAPKMSRSLEAGEPVTLSSTASIADGLLSLRPGDLTFEHVRAYVDQIVTVSEDAIAEAVAWLFGHARLVVEPSGAVTTAAIMSGVAEIDAKAGDVVAIVSGGNVAPEKFAEYITRGG